MWIHHHGHTRDGCVPETHALQPIGYGEVGLVPGVLDSVQADVRREQHMRNPVPPRLLQIALDGAEARSVEAGTGPLGYRDCAVIVNGLRPVLADLHAKVDALDHAWDCDADKPRGAGMPCDCPIKAVIALFDGAAGLDIP